MHVIRRGITYCTWKLVPDGRGVFNESMCAKAMWDSTRIKSYNRSRLGVDRKSADIPKISEICRLVKVERLIDKKTDFEMNMGTER